MFTKVVLVLVLLSTVVSGSDLSVVQHWATASLHLVVKQPCPNWISPNTCNQLKESDPQSWTLYLGRSTMDSRKVRAIIPDGQLDGEHDAILVLDPLPLAAAGHILFVLFLDKAQELATCQEAGGHYLGDGECLTLAFHNKCRNLLKPSGKMANHGTTADTSAPCKCEIFFIPLVTEVIQENDGESPEQMLHCRDDISGFGPCPVLRSVNDTQELSCDPMHVNHQRCSGGTLETVRTQCLILETCDQAVLLVAGWNREHSPLRVQNSLRSVYRMVRSNGFHKANIKVFYANGGSSAKVLSEKDQTFYPAAFKLAVRHHIQRLCRTPSCAESFFLYLHGPSNSRGSILLWDVNKDGLLDKNEQYTKEEIISDLQNCQARRVFVVADHNYSGQLVSALKRSGTKTHRNVLVFASGGEQEYSWKEGFTKIWSNFRHTYACVQEVFQESHSLGTSNPVFYDGSAGKIKTTLFGAPCDITPPYNSAELEHKFYGCQNLPSNVWISAALKNSSF